MRWTGPRLPVIAAATALAMVGALILEPGILARTPETPLTWTLVSGPGQDSPNGSSTGGDSASLRSHPPVLEVLTVDFPPEMVDSDLADAFALAEWVARVVASLDVAPPPASQLSRWIAATGDAPTLPLAPSTIQVGRGVTTGKPAREPRQDSAPTNKPSRPSTRHRQPHNNGSPSGPDGIWRVAPIVTWYGPGFYGQRTACGQRYTRSIIGVAHRTLPCGTLVQFRWHGITATAAVIDRGPYASSDYVFDWSAGLACRVFKPRGADHGCFTRYDVQWRVVRRVH